MASTLNRSANTPENGDEYIVIDTPPTKHLKTAENEKDEIDAPMENPYPEDGEKNMAVDQSDVQTTPNLENGKVKIPFNGMCAKMTLRFFKNLSAILKSLQFVLTILMMDLPNPPGLLFVGHMSLLLIAPGILVLMFNLDKKYFIRTTWIQRDLIPALGVTILNFIGGLATTIDSVTVRWHSDSEYMKWKGYLPAGICGLTIAILGGIECAVLILRHVRCTTKEEGSIQHT